MSLSRIKKVVQSVFHVRSSIMVLEQILQAVPVTMAMMNIVSSQIPHRWVAEPPSFFELDMVDAVCFYRKYECQEFQFRSKTNANFLDPKAIRQSAKSQRPMMILELYGTRLFGFQLRCHHRLGWQDPFFSRKMHIFVWSVKWRLGSCCPGCRTKRYCFSYSV